LMPIQNNAAAVDYRAPSGERITILPIMPCGIVAAILPTTCGTVPMWRRNRALSVDAEKWFAHKKGGPRMLREVKNEL
jgi:hypothetical protein